MKATYFIPILIVGLLFSSCSDDNRDGPIDPDAQGDAKIKLSLTLPPLATPTPAASFAPGTRTDIVGTTPENIIEQIHIFIFDQAGELPTNTAKGVFERDLATDFTQSGNTYTMNEPITTTAGTKTIYVVGNMTENEIETFGSESRLLNREENVHKSGAGSSGLIKYTTDTPPVLNTIVFAGSETASLNADATGTPNAPITVEIERTVSRVIVTSEPSFPLSWTGTNDMTLNISNYLITQDAYKSIVGQNYFDAAKAQKKTLISGSAPTRWGEIISLYDPEAYIPARGGTIDIDDIYVPIVSDPGGLNAGNPRVDLDGFYIGENVTNTPDEVAQHGNTTYAWIQTQLELTATAEMNSTDDGITFTGPALDGNTTFHLIRVNGVRDYICTAGNYQEVFDFLNKPENYQGDVFNFPYRDGYIYYRVFLNQTGTTAEPIGPDDKYNIYRNLFIHLDITAVNVNGTGPGGLGKGYPGDPDNPKVPINPFTPNEPGQPPVNPNPHTREEPIDEEDATLEVNVLMKDWTYSPNGIILQ